MDSGKRNAEGFVDGYECNRCWFRSRWITRDMMDGLRHSLSGSDALNDEHIALICDYLGIAESDTDPKIVRKLDDAVRNVINKLNSNRGVSINHDDEVFLLNVMGWSQYCMIMGDISLGDDVHFIINVMGDGSHSYTVTRKTPIPFDVALSMMSGD